MAVMLGVEDMYKFMYNSKPKPFVRTYSEPVRRVLPAIYNITDTDLNTAGPTRELPPRTCSRYDIRPEMPVGPNGVLEDVVYDMDDTGVYHPNTKKARALEKEMGVDEDKEAVKKKKQKMMYRQRAQKRKEKGERPTGEDQDVGNVAAEHKDSGSDMLALEHSLHVVIKILSEPGKAKLKAIGTESDHWPAFKYSPAAEIALENIITAEGRKRKAALAPPIRFESESGDEEEYESGDDHDDDDWKAPGQRVRRHRLTKTGVCKDCPELGNPRSDLAEDDGSDSTLSNRVQTYTFSENHSGAYSRKGTNNDDPGQSNEIQELYCTCQQPEQGFMIKCEGPCNNWYHGKCVGITRVKARLIPQYICNAPWTTLVLLLLISTQAMTAPQPKFRKVSSLENRISAFATGTLCIYSPISVLLMSAYNQLKSRKMLPLANRVSLLPSTSILCNPSLILLVSIFMEPKSSKMLSLNN